MKKLLALAALLVLGLAGNVMADDCTTVVSATTTPLCTRTVFNDSGSELTSGTVVVWDNDDTEFDRSGYPYVTTTTSTDSPWTAGVMLTGACPNQGLCEIVTRGFAWTRIADATDAVSEDQLVSTTSVAGKAGDWGAGANTCALGMALELYNKETGTDDNLDSEVFPIFVNIQCN